MLRAFDSSGNVIYEQPTAVDQSCLTPEQRFQQSMKTYLQGAAARGIDTRPISQEESMRLSYQYNGAPVVQPTQSPQEFLQSQYNSRIGGMGTSIYQPQMQNGFVGGYNPYSYVQQQQAIAEYNEKIRIEREVMKKISRAAHTFLERPISDEELSNLYDPQPVTTLSYQEQLDIQNDQKLDCLMEKIEYMEAHNISEQEYDFMTATPVVQQKIRQRAAEIEAMHRANKELAPDDMSLADFLNGPANELYYDSIIIEIRKQRQARKMEYDRKLFNSYLPPRATAYTFANLPDHMKRGPSVFDALHVDDSWFNPESDRVRAEIRGALDRSGFNDPANIEKRKQAFFEAVRTPNR